MPKVLFILNDLGGGGAERVFANIANGFVENGIETEFLLGKKRGVYLDMLHPSIPVYEVGGISFYNYLRTFPRLFKKNKYTHIFTASSYTSAAAIIVKKTSGIPAKIYVTHHYSFPASRQLKHIKGDAILKLIHYFITPYADTIIAVSKGSLAWLRKFSHHTLPQGIFIYNPVFDDSIYSLASEPVNFPIDVTGKTILLSVGRLVEQKDPLTLLKAFSIFKQTDTTAVLFILGEGGQELMLTNYIKENNLSASVFLMGFEPNPYKWMARCNVFILSSIYEGFGNVIVEAMALGKTVVSTDCPSGPAEILENGKYGYLCNVKDPLKMSDSITEAIQKPIDENILISTTYQYRCNEIVKKYISIL
ncbi:MAG: glycosyltransferase [Ginsengibacter sp.]